MILSAWAHKRSFLTAKAGRPDVYRAGIWRCEHHLGKIWVELPVPRCRRLILERRSDKQSLLRIYEACQWQGAVAMS